MPALNNPYPNYHDLSPELNAISGRLLAARLNAEALPDFPGRLPETLEEAYAIQTASIARWPDEVAGWKVGMVPTAYRERLAAERLAGPIFKSSIFSVDTNSTMTMPIYSGGFAAVEAEFLLALATTVAPSSRDYSDGELVELVSALHVGVEIASSPMAAVNKLGPCCVVSDFGNNAGLLVGPSVPNWSSLPLESLTAEVSVDNEIVGTASANAIEGGPLQAMRFLLQLCAKRGIELPKDTLISTGAATGVHDVRKDSHSFVDFGSFGSFSVAFESMTPKQ